MLLQVNRHLPFWAWTGAAAGAALGFVRPSLLPASFPLLSLRSALTSHPLSSPRLQIAGNLPGAAIGGFAGSKLGAVRDAKGKAVYEVFKVR